ncbi:hypothetical protein DMENIID0001_108320 [Sergentomyia squamirostris]
MEVAIGNATPPFQREVREWQRVDPNTGALLTGRLEADRWIRDHMNTYGKVVDSQNLSTPNGTHHTQRKQLEVLQARTSTGGAMQVVRSQTVHTSSSRWNSSSTQNGINGSLNFTSTHSNPLSFQHKKLHGETQAKTVTPYAPEPTLSASPSMNSTSSPPSTVGSGVGGHRKQLDPNERETPALNSHGALNRGKSVSNEDLADDDPEPCEWKRVSKIRRSLQYPKVTSPAKYSSRPLDLPENLVSVSRLRQELENGRRLDLAMRNNHVDLAALDSILKGAPDPDHKSETKTTKKATFITAESLKEIRGKLRKLSDESLYKDDILVQIDEEVKNGVNGQLEEHTDGLENNTIMNESRTDAIQQPSTYAHLATTTPSGGFVFRPKAPMANGNSNSLQSRNKVKDLATNEWHYRRKSYGFEKMTPPPESMTSRMETSTDSGIGRSGEIASSWSPTENTTRGTVISLAGDDGKEAVGKATSVTILSNGGTQINSIVTPLRPNSIYFNGKTDDVKRHSIAVDESKYVKDTVRRTFEPSTMKTSSVHINGSPLSDSKVEEELRKGQKRVEFCKTEVHFAAESGRVNIIETDGKPPPTNNFRRRRRSSGGSIGSTYLEAIKSGVPLTHFGDSEQTTTPDQPKPTIASDPDTTTSSVTTTSTTTSVVANTVKGVKEEEEDSNDEVSLRGILKNKPIKPRPYHLGENIENSESLWGVRLRPISTDCTLWTRDSTENPTTLLPNKDDSDYTSGFHSDSNESVRSVAERVRLVEKLKSKGSPTGFSTKVNLTTSHSFNWPLRDEIDPMPQSQRLMVHLADGENDQVPGKFGNFEKSHEVSDSSLKSTTLIMKTLKSAQQFDEAMAKLASVNPTIIVPQSKITSNDIQREIQHGDAMSGFSVAKSNSASNILSTVSKLKVKERYTSSLDGNGSDRDWNFEEVKPQNSISSYLTAKRTIIDHVDGQGGSRKPIAAPRIKKLGNSSVLNQLTQLNRMYEAAGQDSDGSAQADEEVNLIFGQHNRATTPEERNNTTLSGSWSRLRSKRNCTKQTTPNYAQLENYKSKSLTTNKPDVIHSNILSIPFHSPTNSLSKPAPKTDVPNIATRTTSPVKTTPIAIRKIQPTTDNKTISPDKEKPKNVQQEPQKLVCGTRKLRDHELSYFGVNTSQQRASNAVATSSHDNPKRITNTMKTEVVSQQWKADLPNRQKSTKVEARSEYKEPIYENLKYHSNQTSNNVNQRNHNYDRDQDILDELNRAADEILSSVTKNHETGESKLRRRIQSKPLETISEARSSKSVQSRGVQVSRGCNESIRRSGVSRSSCRVSSASSSESIPRQIPSSSLRASTHSSSSKSRHSTRSHEDSSSIRSSRRRVTSLTECRRLHRANSRDNIPSQASSSEDVNEPRRPRRLKLKEKPESSVISESKRSSGSSSKSTSSRRHHKTEATPSRTSRSTSDHHQKIRVKSGIVTTTYVLQSGVVPPPRHKRRRKVARRNSSLLLKKREMKNTSRKIGKNCICS